MTQRHISHVTRNPFHQGFLGTGHQAASVMGGVPYAETDPFILFMDDRLDLPGGEPVGGPHPHAGFETLTLVLKGNETGWATGSFELMTAGKGIVHTEEITARQELHILQVWLALPPEKRWETPSWQRILQEAVPTLKENGGEIRVYSGSSNGLTSPLRNHTPFTLVDFRLAAGSQAIQELPDGYRGLVYVLSGAVSSGEVTIKAGEAGWLDKAAGAGELHLQAEAEDTRFVLYAARPHGAEVVSYGPFIGDNMDDIRRLYREFRKGEIPHLNDLPESRKHYYPASVPAEAVS